MKRVWIALVITVLLVTGCTLGIVKSENECSELNAALQSAEDAAHAGDLATAEREAKRAQALWEDWRQTANLFIHHDELDPPQHTMIAMMGYLEEGVTYEFIVSCMQARTMIEHLTETERPVLGNIF